MGCGSSTPAPTALETTPEPNQSVSRVSSAEMDAVNAKIKESQERRASLGKTDEGKEEFKRKFKGYVPGGTGGHQINRTGQGSQGELSKINAHIAQKNAAKQNLLSRMASWKSSNSLERTKSGRSLLERTKSGRSLLSRGLSGKGLVRSVSRKGGLGASSRNLFGLGRSGKWRSGRLPLPHSSSAPAMAGSAESGGAAGTPAPEEKWRPSHGVPHDAEETSTAGAPATAPRKHLVKFQSDPGPEGGLQA